MFEPSEIYQNTLRRKQTYKILMDSASRMLNKAKIVANIEAAMVLAKILKRHNEKGIKSEEESKDSLDLFMLLMTFYEEITDEAAIVSAFENYAKSILLRKQYVIHKFSFRGSRANNKNKIPLHIRTYIKSRDNYIFQPTTLSAKNLLDINYVKHYSISDFCIEHLKKFNETRNLLHMNTKITSRIGLSELEAINELKFTIESYRKY